MSDWEYDESKMVGEVTRSAFRSVTDSIMDTHSAVTVLAITIAAELGAFAMFYVSKDKVEEFLADSDTNVWLYGAIAVFVVGFFAAFALYRLIADKWPHRQAHFYIWVVSIGAGVFNILVFFGFLTLRLR